MKNKIVLVVMILFVVVVFGGIYIAYGKLNNEYAPNKISVNTTENDNKTSSPSTSENTDNKDKKEYSVDNFTVFDAEGNKVELWDCIGKPLILNFWASWCGPCKSEMPHFEQAYKDNPDICFMMVNVTTSSTDEKSSAAAYVKSPGFTFPVYFDTTGVASEKYGIMYIPMTFLIDKNGNLVGQVDGSMSKEELDECIRIVKGEELTIQ
ncbi:MAG: TlpA family protein disulfide reductase [Clostridia bacterium]|nr:TlpA family protein disulfide reductase [Clostridia bacterium]